MSQAVAYGSITVVDITDLGELSVQPSSNLPSTVIYDPNNSIYTPDWGDTNLQITPIIYYGATQLTPGENGLTITWTKKIGTNGAVPVSTDTTTTEYYPTSSSSGNTIGTLYVKANQFTPGSSLITYIVNVDYTESTAGVILHAQGQMTFGLIKHASNLKNIHITGDSIFKIDASNSVNPSSITLTANRIGNVSITKWQYQSGLNTWTNFTGNNDTLITSDNLTIPYYSSGTVLNSVFNYYGDRAIIRVLTDNDGSNGLYDVHNITILSDGKTGAGTITAILTNEDQMVPYTKTGNSYSISPNFSTESRIIIYQGLNDITSQYTISQQYHNVICTAGTTTKANDTVEVSGMDLDNNNVPYEIGYVRFTCITTSQDIPQSQRTIVKDFSLTRVLSGKDGISPTIYSIEPNVVAINRNKNKTYTPEILTVNAYSHFQGTKSAYSGRFRIIKNYTMEEYKTTASEVVPLYTSSSGDESTHNYTLQFDQNNQINKILCILYEAGTNLSTNTNKQLSKILDYQQVVITFDGDKGEQGDDGESAVNVILGNYADVLTCTSDNKLSAQQIIKIPFAAYEGTTRIPCTFTAISLLGQASAAKGSGSNNSKDATVTSDGQIVWVLPANTSVNAASGNLSITFTATAGTSPNTRTVTVIESYSWSRNTAAEDGKDAVFFEIYAPTGNIFNQNNQSITLQTRLVKGSSQVTSGITYKWYKYNGTYQKIDGETSSSLVINASSVSSYASYKAQAVYDGNTYEAYYAVFDKTDPIQIAIFSSVGEKLINGKGQGALYVIVTRNGVEIDQIKTKVFYKQGAEPAGSSGDFAYRINTNRSITLMKCSGGTSWSAASSGEIPNYQGLYKWSWRDKDGKEKTSYTYNNSTLDMPGMTAAGSNKIIYIDGEMVDSKVIADVQVTI